MSAKLKTLFQANPLPLECMRLGPEGRDVNPLMIQIFTWHHLKDDLSWWKHFELEVPRLAELGVTQVWLPPPSKAAKPKGHGYDAYDLWDLGEFNQKGAVKTRWGTREEYLQACKVAQEYRIDILVDAVLNHKLGADLTEPVRAVPVRSDNRLKEAGPAREIHAWTTFNFSGRREKYSTMRWTHEHFTGVDWDHKERKKVIFKFVGSGHKGWSRNVDSELGNYDYLLGADIDHRHPDVKKDLTDWGEWILKTTGSTGFRVDAVKHIDRKFLLNWIQTIRSRSGRSDLFVVAECWSTNLKAILSYIQAFKGETAFFDVPLHMNFFKASRERARFDLRKIFQGTLVQTRPWDAVTFVDNHEWVHNDDLESVLTQIAYTVEGQSLESWVDENFKSQAYALILLREYGLPCVFYGDLYHTKETYHAVTAQALTLLMQARKLYAYGRTVDYFAAPQKNCVGFVRMGDETHDGCAVVLSNREEEEGRALPFVHELRMNVGVQNANTQYRSFLTADGVVRIEEHGWGTFTCFANDVQVWVKVRETAERLVASNEAEEVVTYGKDVSSP